MAELQLLHDIDALLAEARPTGIGELDRVLDGGLVPGSVTLLGGEPGIGKSTLLLQLLAWWPGPTLYISAEESPQQVRIRAERLGAVRDDLWLAAETSLAGIVEAMERSRPQVMVVDSIQTIADHTLSSPAGSMLQVRACAQQLTAEAKQRGVAVVLVGHVTKDGALAGPRVLEHVVDTVLSFEGDRHHALRMLRAVKHRFGSTDELGLFEMTAAGLIGVPDPSRLFLADRRAAASGSVVVPAMDGRRPLLVEVQSLTVPVPPNVPARRNAQGVDGGRLALLLAVLERRAGIRVVRPGRLRIGRRWGAVDRAGHRRADRPRRGQRGDRATPPEGVVVTGEIGLGGEVRQVAHAKRRLGEALRMGFERAIVPAATPDVDGLHLVRVRTLRRGAPGRGGGVRMGPP